MWKYTCLSLLLASVHVNNMKHEMALGGCLTVLSVLVDMLIGLNGS